MIRTRSAGVQISPLQEHRRDAPQGQITENACARQAPADKTQGVIRALTGATISSDSVCTIVNETVAAVKQPLAAAAE